MRPTWTNTFNWTWTKDNQVHKLLGFLFTEDLNQEVIFNKCQENIDRALQDNKLALQSIQGRLVIANQIIYGYVWFILPLWAGNNDQLRLISKKIVQFVSGGANLMPRQRVAMKVLTLPKNEGGLGFLSTENQAVAFATNTIKWVLTPGRSYPLKTIFLAAFKDAGYTN
ncbi:hypothetical protein R1flu_025013 [Riccia fluitans]|uniref:Uncharacterized protein n=1 Tax=Riccia fluitans TaxID=41844 RepID=A0ABD1XZJ2_9MARC